MTIHDLRELDLADDNRRLREVLRQIGDETDDWDWSNTTAVRLALKISMKLARNALEQTPCR